MEPMFLLEAIDGINDHPKNGGMRFLTGEPSLSARDVFESLNQKDKRTLLDRMDFWLEGGIRDEYFHGFPNHARFKHCFVFKLKKGRVGHRWYGFICNPDQARPRFRLCVLLSHATKTERETDMTELESVEELRTNQRVQALIRMEFMSQTTRH